MKRWKSSITNKRIRLTKSIKK